MSKIGREGCALINVSITIDEMQEEYEFQLRRGAAGKENAEELKLQIDKFRNVKDAKAMRNTAGQLHSQHITKEYRAFVKKEESVKYF